MLIKIVWVIRLIYWNSRLTCACKTQWNQFNWFVEWSQVATEAEAGLFRFFSSFSYQSICFFNTFFLRGADANGWGEILIVVYFDARMIGAVVTAVVGGLVTLTWQLEWIKYVQYVFLSPATLTYLISKSERWFISFSCCIIAFAIK